MLSHGACLLFRAQVPSKNAELGNGGGGVCVSAVSTRTLFSLVLQSLLYDLCGSHVDLVEATLGTLAWRNICLSQSHVPVKKLLQRFHKGSE